MSVIVVRGQQARFPLTGAGTFQAGAAQTLVRAEDPSHRVTAWHVTLSPIFILQIGSTVFAMPGKQVANPPDGNLVIRMSWGGGGVKFQTQFDYPVNGASFAVAGDNIVVEVFALDGATVWTPATLPSCQGWVAEHSHPTSQAPLYLDIPSDQGAGETNAIEPWVRALHVTKSDPAATVVFRIRKADGTLITMALPATITSVRIPLPNEAVRYGGTASAGVFNITQEIAFT